MDETRFDALTRWLSAGNSRRDVTSLLLGGSFGLLGLADAAGKRKKKKKRKKKRRPAPPPAPTCSDGIKNGNETGIDCGGDCPLCANDQGCEARDDCASVFCHESGTCQECFANDDCYGDISGTCKCHQPVGEPVRLCLQYFGAPSTDSETCECPADTVCLRNGPAAPAFCHKRCGRGCGYGYPIRCGSDADCCDTSCDTERSLCLSWPGGRCRLDADCAPCRWGDECNGACDTAAGVCRCPDAYECCSNSDCDSAFEQCQTDAKGLNGKCVPRDIG